VGDALGAPVEFLSLAAIHRRFGPQGIQDYSPAYGGLGSITDDTQMTLFTAEGLLRTLEQQAGLGEPANWGLTAQHLAHAYQRWLHTQHIQPPACAHNWAPLTDDGLVSDPRLHHLRAPGNTCLSALEAMSGMGDMARNHSKGCGGVMRVAPVALAVHALHGFTPKAMQLAFDLGVLACALTHGHPTGQLPGGVLAALLVPLLSGVSLAQALPPVLHMLAGYPHATETQEALQIAINAAASDAPLSAAIAQVGQGWVAEEALAIGLLVALRCARAELAPQEAVEYGLLAAVNHSGDSDSTGAIAGHFLGAQWGVQAIPGQWLQPLELNDRVKQAANHLHGLTV
jgi:ADP-ribosylglycohydrolase